MNSEQILISLIFTILSSRIPIVLIYNLSATISTKMLALTSIRIMMKCVEATLTDLKIENDMMNRRLANILQAL